MAKNLIVMGVLGILKASSELQLRQTVISPQYVLSQELLCPAVGS
jgi:hypothetical protein